MIGIFRTNINSFQEKNSVIDAISASFNVHNCSIDIEDCDKVLRVVANQLPIAESAIINFVQQLGYQCDVME